MQAKAPARNCRSCLLPHRAIYLADDRNSVFAPAIGAVGESIATQLDSRDVSAAAWWAVRFAVELPRGAAHRDA